MNTAKNKKDSKHRLLKSTKFSDLILIRLVSSTYIFIELELVPATRFGAKPAPPNTFVNF